MAYDAINVPLSVPVGVGATIAVSYPAGRNKEAYSSSAVHQMSVPYGSAVYYTPTNFTVAFLDANIIVTLISVPRLQPQVITLALTLADAAPSTPGSGVQQMTAQEIAAGTETAPRTISPKQLADKVAASAGVTSVNTKTGSVTLDVNDIDGAVSEGLTIGVATNGGLTLDGPGDLTGVNTFAADFAASGGDAGTGTKVSRDDHTHAVASGSVKGMMSSAQYNLLAGMSPVNETLIGTFTTGNSTITLTDFPNTVKNPLSSSIGLISASLKGVTKVRVRGTVTTAGASTMRIALKFSVGLSSYSWVMCNGDAVPADLAANPSGGQETAWQAWSIATGGTVGFVADVDVPAACQAADHSSIWMIGWAGDGAADPVLASIRLFVPQGATQGGASLPTTASQGEMQAGTETNLRSMSPKLVSDAIAALAPAGANMVEARFKGRKTGAGTGAAQDLTAAEMKTELSLPTNAAQDLSYISFNGIVDTTLQTLSYDKPSRTLTVTKVSDYDVWVGGTKLTITAATKTVTHTNAFGTYFVYFNSSGNLAVSTTKWTYYGANAPVAIIEFNPNPTGNPLGILVDCRLPYRKAWLEWEYQDLQIGAWLDNGFGMSFGATDGSVSVAAGRYVINGMPFATVSPITTCNIMVRRAAQDTGMPTVGSSDIRYIPSTTLTYDNNGVATPVPTNNYVNQWMVMCAGTLYVVTGQRVFTTQDDAEAEVIDQVQLPGFLKQMGRPLARVTYKRDTATSTNALISYSDIRGHRIVNGVTFGGGGSGGGAATPPIDPTPDGYVTFTVDMFFQGKPVGGTDVLFWKPMNARCRLLGTGLGHAGSARVGAATGAAFQASRMIWNAGTQTFTAAAIAGATFSSGAGNKVAAITSTDTVFEAADAFQVTGPASQDGTLEDVGLSFSFVMV